MVVSGFVNISIAFENAVGTAYFDAIQIEEGELDDYNAAENSVFARGNNCYAGGIHSIGTP